MSLLPLRYRSTRRRVPQTGQLPAPGPFPGGRPENVTVIFVIVLVAVVWLLVRGYPARMAAEAVAAAAAISVTLAPRLADLLQDGD
jgi:hypothetical protein